MISPVDFPTQNMLPPLEIRSVSQVWRITLLAAVASLPAAVIINWLPDSEATIGGAIMIIGASIAGAIAARRSVAPGAVGLRTGFLGGAVAVVDFVFTAGVTVAWSVPRVLFFLFAVGVVLGISPVFGWAFGRIGGWVGRSLLEQ